jgi:replicative DNA helicase
MYFDDSQGLNVTTAKAKLRRVKNLGLVVIDYLGLMSADKKTESRVQEVSEISRNLKKLAMELGVPVVCCAQLNRGTEGQNGERRPGLANLRDSGSIEQDADIVIFLYRDDYCMKNDGPSEAEIIVAKNRHGSPGTVSLGWFGQYSKFTDIEKSEDGSV